MGPTKKSWRSAQFLVLVLLVSRVAWILREEYFERNERRIRINIPDPCIPEVRSAWDYIG